MNIGNNLRKNYSNAQEEGIAKLNIEGFVYDAITMEPIKNACIEIWQADQRGRYLHEMAKVYTPELMLPNNKPDQRLTPFGRADSNKLGRFEFFTIKPGKYDQAIEFQGKQRLITRAPHIHFRVFAKGYETLTTQMYFGGVFNEVQLNQADMLLKKVNAAPRLICEFEPVANQADLFKGTFKIYLEPYVLKSSLL